jgi:transcriptional regulator with XRE-family HTH domain
VNSKVVGEVLRNARQERGLTLHDVQVRSRGRFKPSSLGGYERGERNLSLERFRDLADLYGVPADQLLAKVLRSSDPESRREASIRTERLSLVPAKERNVVAEFVHKVKAQRGDYLSDVITLRSGDLHSLALASGLNPQTLVARLAPALREAVGSREKPRADSRR